MRPAVDPMTPPIGHNSGADAADVIAETLDRLDEIERGAAAYLQAEHADIMRRLREIDDLVAGGLPTQICSKTEAEKLSDVQFAIKRWLAAARSARTDAKRPWDAVAKAFYAFFTRPIDRLEAVADHQIAPVLADWQSREASRIRAEEAERARLAREEADRAQREAAAAAAAKAAAEARRLEAEAAARRAEEKRRAAIAAAEEARRRREIEEQQARDAARRKAADEAAALEARRRADEAKAAEAAARQAAQKAAADRRTAERLAQAAAKTERAEARITNAAADAAQRAEKTANRSEAIANQKPAELSRVRGEAGSVSTLRTYWTFRDLDRAALDLEALRQHLPADALATAVRAFINAGGRELRGATIYETQETLTR